MTSFKVDLHKISDLQNFMTICQECSGNVFAHSITNAKRIANGKSILGIMSLDLNTPIIIEFENPDDVKKFERFEILKED